jgi:hypothetical protein
MTIPQLKAEAFRLAGVLDLANSQRREIRLLIERRRADAVAAQRIAGMDAIEKDALREALGDR